MNGFSDTAKMPLARNISTARKQPANAFSNKHNSNLIPRSANCSCDGGCPACQKKSKGINISEPSDAAEIEADKIAGKAMLMQTGESATTTSSNNSSSSTVQRKCNACEDDEKIIQRKPVPSHSGVPSQSPSHISNAISSGGRPLDKETRYFFEPRMGRDFDNVRIHNNSHANQSAAAIDAKAYTFGNDIVFAEGQYRPESDSGKQLLAHELAHVTQSESSSNIRRDTIHRQFDPAQIQAEIQMLRMQLMMPVNPLRPMQQARLMQLEAMLGQTIAQPSAPSKPKSATTKPSVNTNDDFYASLDDMTQLQLDEMHRQLADFQNRIKGDFGNQAFQTLQPTQAPQVPQSGCHADPFARSTGGSTCGGGHHKQADAAILATQKAMQMPAPDFSAEDAKERAMLDRLNSAHLAWNQTDSFVRSEEFSPYEIQKDRIIPLWKRWDLFEKSDPAKDNIQNPVEYYFRFGNEYIKEKERRITIRPFKDRLYSARLKARNQSDYWYSANEANERMTGEDLWRVGFYNNLFIESEKALVYKEQGSLQQLEREEREARQAQDRRNFEIQQYNNHVARGKQLSSPAGIIQPFAMGAFGAPVAAVYGGMQLGFMGAEAYHACKDGFSGNCAAAAAPIVTAAVVHQVIKPKAPPQPPITKPNTTIVPTVKPTVVQQTVKPTVVEPVVKTPVTPPVIKSPTTEPTVKPATTPPAVKSTTEPDVKPTTIKTDTAIKPTTKPVETNPVATPATKEPVVNPRQALEQARIANQTRIAELDNKVLKHQKNQKDYDDKATRIETERKTPDFRDKAANARRQATNEKRLADNAAAERQQLQRQNEFISKTLNPPPAPKIGPGPGQPRGGAHKDIPTAGGEVNHIPPDSVTKMSTGRGPAIWMEKADHMQTNSWGQRTFKPTRQYPYSSADEWRAAQSALIKKGKFKEAIQMDIDDIRAKFGSKYEAGIQEMLEYVKTLKQGEF